jgi:hypothetical protein
MLKEWLGAAGDSSAGPQSREGCAVIAPGIGIVRSGLTRELVVTKLCQFVQQRLCVF